MNVGQHKRSSLEEPNLSRERYPSFSHLVCVIFVAVIAIIAIVIIVALTRDMPILVGRSLVALVAVLGVVSVAAIFYKSTIDWKINRSNVELSVKPKAVNDRLSDVTHEDSREVEEGQS